MHSDVIRFDLLPFLFIKFLTFDALFSVPVCNLHAPTELLKS